jgi:hypothetical protein
VLGVARLSGMIFASVNGKFFCFQIYNVSSKKAKRKASNSPEPSKQAKKKGGQKPKATVTEDGLALTKNPESPFWNKKLEVFFKEKTQYKEIKVLPFFNQKAPNLATFFRN